jgi:sugar O-acyltransferase (sialic acid O-acetyltransferase NeuD family)
MRNKLIIIGASGHGKVVADIAMKMARWREISFLDDNEDIKSSMGISVIGKVSDVSKYINEYDIFVGIGNNAIRKDIHEKLEGISASIPTLIHPSAIIGEQVELGVGTVVMAGVVINCCTKIGKGCIINTSATIDHDGFIADFVHVSPGVHIAGTVTIESCTWIGVGSSIIQNITITSDCIVGAGSVVVTSLNEKGTYVGVPARRIKE